MKEEVLVISWSVDELPSSTDEVLIEVPIGVVSIVVTVLVDGEEDDAITVDDGVELDTTVLETGAGSVVVDTSIAEEELDSTVLETGAGSVVVDTAIAEVELDSTDVLVELATLLLVLEGLSSVVVCIVVVVVVGAGVLGSAELDAPGGYIYIYIYS